MTVPSHSDVTVVPHPFFPLGHDCVAPDSPDPEAIAAALTWLGFHRLWGSLGDEILGAIAAALQLVTVQPDTPIYAQEQGAIALYFLKWGTVEIYRQSTLGRTHIHYRSAGELFGYVPLVAAGSMTYQASAIALTACEIWLLKQGDVARLLAQYPTIQTPINQLLAQDLGHFAQRIAWEEVRLQRLQPYTRPVPTAEPLLGHSKAAQKIAQQVAIASADTQPIILQAPAGAGKTFIAGYIHSRSRLAQHPFAEIDCAQFPCDAAGLRQTDSLFGVGETQGILELLERGTLLIDHAHLLPDRDRERLRDYLQTGRFTRNGVAEDSGIPPQIDAWVRLIWASPRPVDLPGLTPHRLKLFTPLQRKDDIPDFAEYLLTKFCREQGRDRLTLNQSDLRRLISYDYPGNFSELAGILQRAVMMTPPEQTTVPEQVLWSVQSEKNAFRLDLLDQLPWLRRFFLSAWWPERFWIIVMAIFIPVTVMGYIGPQTRESSMTLNFFWAWWWPGYLFLFAFVGRVWCSICPFMITGEWLRTISLWLWPRELLPWPTRWLNRWGAWLLFAGFVVIYLWEHLWDLPHTAYLSSWLLIAITAGAVLGSLVYERRVWCRYLCPIGGMNGMFAKLSLVEVRSLQQVCGSQCHTFGCYKGSPATPVTFSPALPTEGQATAGCPLYSHPAQLQDNRDCVLCMTCLKACPHRSVQVNLRFPAADLLENHQGFWAEVALLLLLFGGVFMHNDRVLLHWFGFRDLPIDAAHLLTSLPIVTVLLATPAVLTYGAHQLARLMDHEMPSYLTVIYAYLPLTLAANLADYIPAGMEEAGQILPVMARTFGYDGPLLQQLPTYTWSPDVSAFLQGITLLSGLVFSVYPLLRITQRPVVKNWPHLVLMTGLIVLYFYLMV